MTSGAASKIIMTTSNSRNAAACHCRCGSSSVASSSATSSSASNGSSIGTHGTTSLNGSAGLFEAAEVANGGHNNSSNPNKPTSQHYDTATKIAHRLHQIEIGQKKIIQLLTNLDRDLKLKRLHFHQGSVREEQPSDLGEGERLVKIQLQDAKTSTTKHVAFRIDKSIQTSGDIDLRDEEITRLREELSTASAALATAMSVNSKGEIDYGAESPLNLFIQCFKEKYGLSVNPNDVAIFV